MSEVKELEKRIKELEDELEEAKDEISDLETSIDVLEGEKDDLESEIFDLRLSDQIDIEYLPDAQKFELLQEHWEYITLEDIENLLKSKGRI